MPFTATVPDDKLLASTDAELLRISVEMAKYRADLQSRAKGRALPEFRGTTVLAVNDRTVSLREEASGNTRTVPLTLQRAKHLVLDASPSPPPPPAAPRSPRGASAAQPRSATTTRK